MSENMEDLVKIPSWIEEDSPDNDGDVTIRHCMIRVLRKTPKEAIVETTRMVLAQDDIVNCSSLYAYELYRMLLNKGIKIHELIKRKE